MASPARRWIPVIVWVAVIYTTIPFVRSIREWYVARWDPVWIAWLVAGILVVAATMVVTLLLRKTDRPSIGKIAWVAGLTVVLVLWTFSLRRSPEESVHFLEYGILALLLYRALVPTMPNVLVFVAASAPGNSDRDGGRDHPVAFTRKVLGLARSGPQRWGRRSPATRCSGVSPRPRPGRRIPLRCGWSFVSSRPFCFF